MLENSDKPSFTLKELSIITNECYFNLEEIIFRSNLFIRLPTGDGEQIYTLKSLEKIKEIIPVFTQKIAQ